MMSVGSTGELKNASPTSFIDFDNVYVTMPDELRTQRDEFVDFVSEVSA